MEQDRDARNRFVKDYRQSLREFLMTGAGEAALFRAYDLGRRAMAARVSLVDLVSVHHAAVAEAARGPFPTEEDYRLFYVNQGIFLQQCLAPFEMVTRGFAEATVRYRAISELTSDFAFGLHADPVATFVLEWVTDSFPRITGYALEEVARQLPRLVHPDDLPYIAQAFAELRSGRLVVFETRVVTKCGEIRRLRVRGRPIWDDDHGRVIRVYGAAQDITDQVRVETEREDALARERAAREQAETAVRVRDEFLSIAAHELKTPMVSLRLAVQFLQQQLARRVELEPMHLQRTLRAADLQIGRLSLLVGQLLEVSRLQLDRLELERATVDFAALVGEAVELAQARTTRHQLRFLAPAHAWVWIDSARVEQVITNLLDNAIKYSPDGGAIEVALDAVTPDAVQLTVRDHGLGIPRERRAHLFELFYQAHAESHRSGMGIGLFVSRRIVELHGGRIALTFPNDGGTCVIVELPAGPESLPLADHLEGDR